MQPKTDWPTSSGRELCSHAIGGHPSRLCRLCLPCCAPRGSNLLASVAMNGWASAALLRRDWTTAVARPPLRDACRWLTGSGGLLVQEQSRAHAERGAVPSESWSGRSVCFARASLAFPALPAMALFDAKRRSGSFTTSDQVHTTRFLSYPLHTRTWPWSWNSRAPTATQRRESQLSRGAPT